MKEVFELCINIPRQRETVSVAPQHACMETCFGVNRTASTVLFYHKRCYRGRQSVLKWLWQRRINAVIGKKISEVRLQPIVKKMPNQYNESFTSGCQSFPVYLSVYLFYLF